MAKALEPANYEILSISKDGGKDIPLEGKTTSFDYYESILSPNITATMTFVDTGGSVGYPQEYDRQERVGSIYNALPITGGEKLGFGIESKAPSKILLNSFAIAFNENFRLLFLPKRVAFFCISFLFL